MTISLLLFAAINLCTLSGVDPSGLSDSGAAVNKAFQNISNQKVVISCPIRTCQPLIIQGQESFIIEGEGDRPVIAGGPSITGCGISTGAVLTINRSGFWTLHGFGIYTGDVGLQSSFTRSLDIDNSGGGGFTTTHGVIEHMAFTTSIHGGKVPGYVGVNLVGQPNVEHMVMRDNWFHGQNSPGSAGIAVVGLNSDNDRSDGDSFSSFFHAIEQRGGNIRITNDHFGANGNFSVFGPGGAAIFITYCTSGPVNILYNEVSDGGPFINSNNDQNGGCLRGLNIIGNIVGVSDLGPIQYPVNIGTVAVPYVVTGNDFYVFPSKTTKSVMGSDSQGNCKWGPLGTLIDIGNSNSFPANTGGWSGCVNGPDFQGGHTQR